MNKTLNYLEEPKLLFGNNQKTEDPRDGLSFFGPFDQFDNYSVQAGVIGTEAGIQKYRDFVTRIQKPIISQNIQRPTYLGFEAVFGVSWSPEPFYKKLLDEEIINNLILLSSLKERSYKLVNLYLDAIIKARNEEDMNVNIWFIVIPKSIWLNCRPHSKDQKISKTKLNYVKALQEGQQTFFSDIEEEVEEIGEFLDSNSDFHHQLKARILKEKLNVPVQIILEPTLEFKDKYREIEYEDEMKAHLAWTQTSTIYYKLGKLPWKLDEIRKGVCYVGLVFKRFDLLKTKGFACSAAQMFLDSGDGTIFRGNVGPWLSKSETEFHLNKESAKELIKKALTAYLERWGEYPKELFIHGRARFEKDEWNGFEEAVQETMSDIRLTGIVIKGSAKLKIFRDAIGEDCRYGNLRGLALNISEREGFLWTRGFVPRLNTSTSLEIPNPLRIQIDKGNAEIEQVMRDILALTKLNYNACLYGDGLPVTLRFSDAVGSILTAIENLDVEVLPFKFYI